MSGTFLAPTFPNLDRGSVRAYSRTFQATGPQEVTSVEKANPEYKKPEIRDYGELRKLTAATAAGSHTDVPKGSSAPNVFS